MNGEHWGLFHPYQCAGRGPSCINNSGLIDEYLKDLLKIIKTTNRLKIPTGAMFFSLRGYASIPLGSIITIASILVGHRLPKQDLSTSPIDPEDNAILVMKNHTVKNQHWSV